MKIHELLNEEVGDEIFLAHSYFLQERAPKLGSEIEYYVMSWMEDEPYGVASIVVHDNGYSGSWGFSWGHIAAGKRLDNIDHLLDQEEFVKWCAAELEKAMIDERNKDVGK